eukprot:CAMPEP_0196130176 /NCGR_PEP_ID=MMETSP0910-20130528/641_1 /TAXON_ID=49265 /ORGANISM="Thalassiosira rotula, Strain GSO102" /LENGTH=323 /DNA_ID=CAMNT_0041389429 /DNA_START=89 /DNA_END=1057 /DNA_ORIENTATION=-
MSESEASFNDADATAQEIADSLRKMNKVVNNLMARADCIPFREPVDWKGLQLYDYPKIITKMMDLGTIKSKLEKSKYTDASQVAHDIRLVWKNCMTYNADGSDFYRLAESYSKRFEERYAKLLDEYGEDVVCAYSGGKRGSGGGSGGGNGSGSGSGGTRGNTNKGNNTKGSKKSRSNSFVSSSGRTTPVPNSEKGSATSVSSASKAENNNNNNNNNYTNGENDEDGAFATIVPLDARARFASRLQRLSGMELGHVLQVIDMQCPEALEDPSPDRTRSDATPPTKRHRYAWDEFDGGCQIEVDVDAIPRETFWKLDAYAKEKVV